MQSSFAHHNLFFDYIRIKDIYTSKYTISLAKREDTDWKISEIHITDKNNSIHNM